MADSLLKTAKQLLADLWERFAMKRDPVKAPWPPGEIVRVVDKDRDGPVIQLRDGAALPPDIYLAWWFQGEERAELQSVNLCPN